MDYISELHDYSCPETEEAKEFLSQGRKDGIKKEIGQIVEDEFGRLVEYADECISQTAARRAKQFLEAVLKGDPEAGMKLLGSRDGGDRYQTLGCDQGKPWAGMHHGHLFETDGIRLRREIVEAHPDLLRNERIADLESIVEGLKQQVQKLELQIDEMTRRF